MAELPLSTGSQHLEQPCTSAFTIVYMEDKLQRLSVGIGFVLGYKPAFRRHLGALTIYCDNTSKFIPKA